MTSTAPGSILYALQPSTITETADFNDNVGGSRNSDIYRLGDAKEALDIPFEHTSEDANIALHIQEAQAILESASGLNLSDVDVLMFFDNPVASGVEVLELSESDVKKVNEVYDIDNDGVRTLIAANCYQCYRADGRSYIQRTDGKFFRFGYGRVAEVKATRGVQVGSRLAHMVRAAMNMLIIEIYKGIGATSPAGFSENPAFRRILRMITSQTANTSVV